MTRDPDERLAPFDLAGPAGRLEALLHTDRADQPKKAAVVAHPHPLYGGTMHNKVVHRIDRGLHSAGAAVLRFNYRGVGTSAGRYDQGFGERQDLLAALDAMASRYPGRPLIAAGFSFGARLTVEIGWSDPRVERMVVAGLPAEALDSVTGPLTKPLLLIHGSKDDQVPFEPTRARVAEIAGPIRLEVIEGADHFFNQHLDRLEAVVRGFVV